MNAPTNPTPETARNSSVPLAAICLVILLALTLLSLLPDVLGRQSANSVVTDTSLAKEGLLKEIAHYEFLLEGNVCGSFEQNRIVQPVIKMPNPVEGSDPSTNDGSSTQNVNLKPKTPLEETGVTPPKDPQDLRLPLPQDTEVVDQERPDLLQELIDQATVLVISQEQVGRKIETRIGSGFFVNATDILTNHHVVKESAGTVPIYVGNRTMEKIQEVEVVALSQTDDIGKRDLALLRLPEPVAQTTFPFTRDLKRLQNVIAAGYPFVVMNTDARFLQLKSDLEAAQQQADLPFNVPTFGRIMARQPRTDDLEIILHRASISPGNSGGPLLDECGRLTGINTFFRPDSEKGDRIFYALGASDAVEFLSELGVEVPVIEGECVTSAASETPSGLTPDPVEIEKTNQNRLPGAVPPNQEGAADK